MAVITNMAFINVMVVVVRLWWFKRKLLAISKYPTSTPFPCQPLADFAAGTILKPGVITTSSEFPVERTRSPAPIMPAEPLENVASVATVKGRDATTSHEVIAKDVSQDVQSTSRDGEQGATESETPTGMEDTPTEEDGTKEDGTKEATKEDAGEATKVDSSGTGPSTRITFAPTTNKPLSGWKALYIPPPRARDNGKLTLFIDARHANRFDRGAFR